MKRAVWFIFIFSVLACFLFSSCSTLSFIQPVASLLNPPLYYPEYEELVEAFEAEVKSDNQFCIPREGDYNSAIVLEDTDGDKEKEALIFYKNRSEAFATMHYFDLVNGEWQAVDSFNGYGNSVRSVSVKDTDKDGVGELIVIWETAGVQTGDIMSVYRKNSDSKGYVEIANEHCLISYVVDIDSDGFEEIFYISQSSSTNNIQKLAKVLRLSGNSVVIMGETKLDANISSYVSVKTEKAAENSPMKIYVDALKGEKQMITEMIYWDKDKSLLVAPWLDSETLTNSITLRYEPVECADINNDGIIDIPVQMQFGTDEENKDMLESERLYLTSWINIKDDTAEIVFNTLINLTDGYLIKLTDEEINSIGVRVYKQMNCWVVYFKNEYKNTEEAIFSVMKIDKNKWETGDFESYISVSEKNEGVVCVYITETGKDLGITEQTIKSKIVNFS